MTGIPSRPPPPALAPRQRRDGRRLLVLFFAALLTGVSLQVTARSPCPPALLGLELRAIELDGVAQPLPSPLPSTYLAGARGAQIYSAAVYDPESARVRSINLRRQP
jgi:hypothetical protein